jgi:hypothetical protein
VRTGDVRNGSKWEVASVWSDFHFLTESRNRLAPRSRPLGAILQTPLPFLVVVARNVQKCALADSPLLGVTYREEAENWRF